MYKYDITFLFYLPKSLTIITVSTSAAMEIYRRGGKVNEKMEKLLPQRRYSVTNKLLRRQIANTCTLQKFQ